MNFYYCTKPFTDIYSDGFGRYMPCCHATVNHPNKPQDISSFTSMSVDETSLMEWYNSHQLKQLREDMKIGKITPLISDVCRKCIASEKIGLKSDRIEYVGDLEERSLFIKMRLFGNSCNLSCYMCNIKNSSKRISQTQKMIEIDPFIGELLGYDNLPEALKNGDGFDYSISNPEVFARCITDLKNIAPKIREINIIGGEPFIMASHYKVLDALIECGESKNIILSYTSNLTKLTWSGCRVIDYLKYFKEVNISWSLESIKEKNNYIRFGSSWDELVSNVNVIRPLVSKFDTTICLTSLSILNLDETLNWCKEMDLTYHLLDVQDPIPCRVDSLHPIIRSKLLEKYKGSVVENLLSVNVDDWKERWNNLIRYLNALDTVNNTDYKKVFPILTSV
jgi:organic radical activating enzyme